MLNKTSWDAKVGWDDTNYNKAKYRLDSLNLCGKSSYNMTYTVEWIWLCSKRNRVKRIFKNVDVQNKNRQSLPLLVTL